MKPEEVLNNKYFTVNIRMLKSVALWPYQKRSLKIVVRIWLLISIYSMMLPQMIRGIEECQSDVVSFEIVFENLSGFLFFQGIIAKFAATMYTEKKLITVFEEVTKDWKQIKDEAELAILHRFAEIGRKLTIIYLVYLFFSCLGFVAVPGILPIILNVLIPRNESFKKSLCIYAEYFVDQDEYFFYLFFHNLYAAFITVVIAVAVDTAYVNCTQHVLGLFNIIQYRLKKVFEIVANNTQYNSQLLEDHVHKSILSSIQMHKKSIEFTDLIQSAYTDCFFFVSGLLLFGISLFTVDLVLNLRNPINFLRILLLWTGSILYMFYVNWPGQKLIDTSQELFQTIYASGWYRFSEKTKVLVKLMLLRSSVPCRLTAGPLLDMNFASCGLILKSAMSYFTVFVSMG